jgi:hypothetical protein
MAFIAGDHADYHDDTMQSIAIPMPNTTMIHA